MKLNGKIRMMAMGAALGAVFLFSGCGGTNYIEKPEANNGIYETGNKTNDALYMKYSTTVEFNGEKYANYTMYTTNDTNRKYKDMHEYVSNKDFMMDKTGKIWLISPFNNTKLQAGTFKPGEIQMAVDNTGVPKGTYKKTDKKEPTEAELNQKIMNVKWDEYKKTHNL